MSRDKKPPTGPPRPFAWQPTPADFTPPNGPKLSTDEIAKLARRETEISKATGAKVSGHQHEFLKAKQTFEPQRAEAAKAVNQKAHQAQASPEKLQPTAPAQPSHASPPKRSAKYHEFMKQQC